MSPNTLLSFALGTAAALGGATGCRHASTTSAAHGCPDVDCSAVSPARIERQPVLTLQEHGPWGSPYDAAQGPAFRLYEDGRLLFTAGKGEAARVMQADLTPDEVYALLDAARDVLDPMPAHTDLAGGATDRAQTSISLTHDNRTWDVDVYGLGREGPRVGSDLAAFVALCAKLRDLHPASAVPWQPDEIEVVMWKRDGGDPAVAAWPAAIPPPPAGVRVPRPFRHPNGKSVQERPIIYRVDGALEAGAEAALQEIGAGNLVQWRSETWLVVTRRVVPG